MVQKRTETPRTDDGARRQDRLKAALKANLHKRKEQAQQRKAAASGQAAENRTES